ncbi:ATP-binding protein [Nocardioides sp. Root151]|uniref:ATP-binding protein n=1 Tax=Nocardioides sp. Root151 TaxID=1736475 RepID=UPI000703BDEA|nr:BTAD domain-containing putative transcriptional regulator [Nocardioides sp. Root151]KQZ66292.1 hypothetical protein ASD66_22365 [Nocardioides sp. Root151]
MVPTGPGPVPRLCVLDGVLWNGAALPGERIAALLGTLVAEPHGVSDTRLIEEVWSDSRPERPLKALQVLVSRLRTATDAALVERYDGGYRLGLPADDVDAWCLGRAVTRARSQLAADPAAALAALEDTAGVVLADQQAPGPLAAVRAVAASRLDESRELRGRALAATGQFAEALPLLQGVLRRRPDDTGARLALLRSIADTSGPAEALVHYEAYRHDLGERLGVSPDPELQRLHGELLAADDPVRTGIRFDGGALLGREGDLADLRTALANGRLTTIMGPGGIGKTSVAQALARESSLPRVHVVELVGVGSGDDVVAEVGAALGVRGSMTTRRTLTPAQEADVRGRIAQSLGEGPTLLVLDNCEHVLEAVASLVAFLLVSTRDLRILTTSRAPLRIAAERIVPLSQLAEQDAAELFRQRARAVRPDASLDPTQVAGVVARLDGLPLAVELAAARVRTMSVAEIRRGLERRFELLRTRDRGAPARHRTLEAVIGWSWDLLDDAEQRALRWLSVFHDGFDTVAAASVIGAGAADLLETLVDQSLLVVSEHEGVTRFRSLETIREFASLRLNEAGERDAAWLAQDAWAAAIADDNASIFVAVDQVERVHRLRLEENNLTDVLRRALARGDAELVARLVASLGTLWTITGDHARVFAVSDAAAELLTGWDAPEAVQSVACEAAAILLVHLNWVPGRPLEELRRSMQGWDEPDTPWAKAAYTMFAEPGSQPDPERLAVQASAADDPLTAGMMMMWAALTAENNGDAALALDYATRGLTWAPLTPYIEASLHSEISQLQLVLGDHREAARHAEIAWPTLMRLHATDDARSLRITTALARLVDGDPDTAERILDEVEAISEGVQLGSRMTLQSARAEVRLARGDVEGGLRDYDEAVLLIEDAETGVGFTPWLVLGASCALVARVHHAPPGPDPRADELARMIRAHSTLGGQRQAIPDLPLNGMLVVSLGAWLLRHGDQAAREVGVRLLAVGQRWAYNRTLPSLRWELLAALAERMTPGRLDVHLAEYAGRPSVELVPEVADLLGTITSSR